MAFRAGAGTFARRLANLCHGSGKQQQGLPPLFSTLPLLPFSPLAAMRHGSAQQPRRGAAPRPFPHRKCLPLGCATSTGIVPLMGGTVLVLSR